MSQQLIARGAGRLVPAPLAVSVSTAACGGVGHTQTGTPAGQPAPLVTPVDVGRLFSLLIALPSADRDNVVNGLEPQVREGLEAVARAAAGAALAN